MVARNNRGRSQRDRWAGHRDPRNRLLEILLPDDWACVEPLLARVDLASAQVVEAPGAVSAWLHFPESAIISVVNTLADGRQIEVGTVGNEGMCGLPAWHEADSDNSQSVCHVAGTTLRGRAAEIIEAAARRPAIRRLLSRYASAYIGQVAQGTACNRRHSLEQRCARWLLMTHDRVTGSHLLLTREFLAVMLGVPSSGAALAIRALHDHGLIRASHDRVDIIDRVGLEQWSCECYKLMRDGFDMLA